MRFKDCKKDMRVRYQHSSSRRHGWEGVIARLNHSEESIQVVWDNGDDDVFYESIVNLIPIVKINANMSDPEEFAFFAKVPEGCCPCGIPRESKRCPYH